jgi:hypothetical protein
MLNRRDALLGLIPLAAQPACSQPGLGHGSSGDKPSAGDEHRWSTKFAGLKGGELFVDAFGEKDAVMIYNERGHRFYTSATLSRRNASFYTYGAEFGVPITLRATWRTGQGIRATKDGNGYEGGVIAGDFTALVAERIPNQLLNDLRKNGGGFRLKLRLHDDGLLVGWDIRRGLSFFMTGGDFKEARIVYDGYGNDTKSRLEPGWYVHPRTGQKIETDF